MKEIAIVCIAYNREKSLARLLNSISKAYVEDETTLIISIDKSNNPLVKTVADEFQWSHGEKRIIAHPDNLGLRKHILGCGQLLDEFDAIIMLEDDLVVSPNFYSYSKSAVSKYCSDDRIAGISLYSFHVNQLTTTPFFPEVTEKTNYFMTYGPSWGQVWMKKQWKVFYDWYKKNDAEFSDAPHLPTFICHWGAKSWLKYHIKYAIENNKYFVYPYVAYSTTCGDAGEHTVVNSSYCQVCLQNGKKLKYDFADFNDDAVKYDAFFERVGLLPELKGDVCIDILGNKMNLEKKRYWLTTKSESYKILKQYKLTFKPIEANIVDNNYGDDIFLYDTSIIGKAPRFNRLTLLYKYDIQNLLRIIDDYSINNIMRDVFFTFKKRYLRWRRKYFSL
jgi:hypothetical protein